MKWRYQMETDWYGGMGAPEQAVIDALELVNETYWSHPVRRAYQRASESGRVPAALFQAHADLTELFHAAKQVAAQAAPNFPLSPIILGHMYPRPMVNCPMDARTATSVLTRIASDMSRSGPLRGVSPC